MKSVRAIALFSIIGGILIHLAVFLVIRIEGPGDPAHRDEPPPVRYVGSPGGRDSPVLQQQAALFDSAPLFMPTQWNLVSEMSDVASLREATEIFGRFPPALRLPAYEPPLPGPGSVQEIIPGPLLPDGPRFYLARFGREASSPVYAASEGPGVRVEKLSGPQRGHLQGSPLPEPLSALAPSAFWGPARFYLHLSGGIPVGRALLIQSSGFPEWDEALHSFLGSLAFYRLLDDGYYRLSVFP